jgi:cytochrome b561
LDRSARDLGLSTPGRDGETLELTPGDARRFVMSLNPTTAPPAELRDRAVEQLKKKRAFYGHLLVYTLVNATTVIVWAMTSDGGFFWPIFLMLGWGIGVVMNAWDVWHGEFTEEQIAHEMERLQSRH